MGEEREVRRGGMRYCAAHLRKEGDVLSRCSRESARL